MVGGYKPVSIGHASLEFDSELAVLFHHDGSGSLGRKGEKKRITFMSGNQMHLFVVTAVIKWILFVYCIDGER